MEVIEAMGIRMSSSEMEWVAAKDAAHGEDHPTLQTLSRQERIQIFLFPWAISLLIGVLSFVASSDSVTWIGLAGSAALAMSPLLFLTGMRKRYVVHMTCAICTFCAMGIAWQTGGILSAQLAWLILLPMMPLRLISIRAGLFWMSVSLMVFAGFGWGLQTGAIAAIDHSAGEYFTWTLLQRVCLCLCMLSLPWYYTKMYQKSMDVLKFQNKLIHQKKQELQRAKNSKKKFISRLSHEMRTPMNAVIGFSHLLQAEAANDANAASVISHIETTSQHLLSIINGIMDYTLLMDGRLKISKEPVDLIPLVQQTFHMFAQRVRSMQIDFVCQLPSEPIPLVVLDGPRLRLILMYLLEHALQRTYQGHVHLTLQLTQQHVLVLLDDSGLGFTEQDMAVFNDRGALQLINTKQDPDASARAGLRMAHALVCLMGGELSASNRSHPLGASIRLSLPLQWEAVKGQHPRLLAEPSSSAQVPSHTAIQVLVVDDNPVNRLLVTQVIRAEWPQAHVLQADNGRKALAMLDTQPFDLVLMDMLMPEMDGIEATRVLRQSVDRINRHIPVLGLTANISTDDHIRCIKAGMNDVFLKPFDKQQLTQRIHSLLEAAGMPTNIA